MFAITYKQTGEIAVSDVFDTYEEAEFEMACVMIGDTCFNTEKEYEIVEVEL